MGVCPRVTICLMIVATLCLLQLDSILAQRSELDNTEDDAPGVIEDELEQVYGLPGIQFEYRFEVGAGAVHCYYQKLQQDSQLQLTFEVRTEL